LASLNSKIGIICHHHHNLLRIMPGLVSDVLLLRLSLEGALGADLENRFMLLDE
jgi:hypothetical protein